MAIRYIDLMTEITPDLPPFPVAQMGEPVLNPLAKPLRECRVMILSSAGIHTDEQPPFSPPNDMRFYQVPHNLDPEGLRISHVAPVRGPGMQDINVLHPYQRLQELAQEGFIGGVTAYHLTILGAIKKLRELVTELAPSMAQAAREGGADLVLCVPL